MRGAALGPARRARHRGRQRVERPQPRDGGRPADRRRSLSTDNGGFSHGCNTGWRAGQRALRPVPESRCSHRRRLPRRAGGECWSSTPDVGAVAPRIVHADGTLGLLAAAVSAPAVDVCARRSSCTGSFRPRRGPTSWSATLQAYAAPQPPDWVSGACILVRRRVLEELDGFDEGFFMYCEDIDLCRRLAAAGHGLAYEPRAVVAHEGGASAPRASLLPVLAASRIRYATKHRSRRGGVARARRRRARGAHTSARLARRSARSVPVMHVRCCSPRRSGNRASRSASRTAGALAERPSPSSRCPTSRWTCCVRNLRSRSVAGRTSPSHRAGSPRPDDRRDDPSRSERPWNRTRADGIALGVRRLSVVDVEGGHQPFANEDGSIWAVQNGELYNHDDIRDATRPVEATDSRRAATRRSFRISTRTRAPASRSSCAASSASRSGTARERRAVIARDRLGVKPLYYAEAGDLLVFASELKSVLASGLVGTELDYEAIDAYPHARFRARPDDAPRRRAQADAGHSLIVDRDGASAPRRTGRTPSPRPSSMTLDEAGEGLMAGLDESVRLRLMSDVPLGAMLSGGIDSSVIVGLMARHMDRAREDLLDRVRRGGQGNELADARLVAEHFGTDHHELELSFAEQTVDLASSSGSWTSRSPTCPRSVFSRSRSSRPAQ